MINLGSGLACVPPTSSGLFWLSGRAPNFWLTLACINSKTDYSGPCTIDEAAGKVTLKVEAAWRPNYVGTEQVRFFRFENGKMFFGPATGSMRVGTDTLTRRLTLERVP